MAYYSESTLRRKAYKINYQVVKGFMHCGNYVWHDVYGDRRTGYMVKDLTTGFYVWDGYNENFDFLWDLNEVERFLKDQYELRDLEW